MVQVIRRTPQAPKVNKGKQFAEAVQGSLKAYADYDTKIKQDEAVSDYLGFDVSNIDPETRKEIVKQTAKTKARSQYYGGNDPLTQPQPGTFSEQLQSAPVDVQTGETPASEYAGESPGQKIKKLENQVENFQYEEDDDYERPKITKPKQIPIPSRPKLPYTPDQIRKELAINTQNAKVMEDTNANIERRYQDEMKRIQQANQHSEKQAFKQKQYNLDERKYLESIPLKKREEFKKEYDKDKPFIDDITQSYKSWISSDKPRLQQLQSLDSKKIISPTAEVFRETLGIPLGALDDPTSELFQKVSLDMLKGLPESYGNRIMKVEVENFLKTIPSLLNSPNGRRMIISNFLKLGEMKEAYYSAMRNQQINVLDNSKQEYWPLDFQQRVFDQVSPQLNQISKEFSQLGEIKQVPKGEAPYFVNGQIIFIPESEWAESEKRGAKRIW